MSKQRSLSLVVLGAAGLAAASASVWEQPGCCSTSR